MFTKTGAFDISVSYAFRKPTVQINHFQKQTLVRIYLIASRVTVCSVKNVTDQGKTKTPTAFRNKINDTSEFLGAG